MSENCQTDLRLEKVPNLWVIFFTNYTTHIYTSVLRTTYFVYYAYFI